MMEWCDWGLKSGDDVIDALRRTESTAHQMHKVLAAHGTRFTGLLADAVDLLMTQNARMREVLLRDGGMNGHGDCFVCGACLVDARPHAVGCIVAELLREKGGG